MPYVRDLVSLIREIPVNQQLSSPPSKLKSVLAHQTRPGLQVSSTENRQTAIPALLCRSGPWEESGQFAGRVALC